MMGNSLFIRPYYHQINIDMHILIFGATSAIAHSIAKEYAIDNLHTYTLIGRSESRLNACKQELQAYGAVDIQIMLLDFSSIEDIQKIFNQCIQQRGSIDMAIVAQGSLTNQDKAKSDMRYLADEFSLNAMSHIIISQLIVNQFNMQGYGILIGIGSVAGERGRKGNYAYGAAKSAVTTFLSGLRHANKNEKIHIMTVKPGFVSTPMTSELPQSFLFVSPELVAKEIKRGVEQGIEHMYVPTFWRFIMMIIRSIPEALFKKLNI